MKYIQGDLLNSDCDCLVHCCNSFKIFGSGIAYYIKNKYPQVYQADLEHKFTKDNILGNHTKAKIDEDRMIYNLYAMWGLGNDGTPSNRNLSYDAFYDGLIKICRDINYSDRHKKFTLGVPYLIGCVRAGGSWDIVKSIIENVESQFENITFEVYKLEDAETIAHSFIPDNYNNK